MDIQTLKQPVDRIRLATILDEAFGVVEPEATTEELLTRLEAELFKRRQQYEDERASHETIAAELGAWRSGALSFADCTCSIVRKAARQCPVHSQPRTEPEKLGGQLVVELERLVSRMREHRGSSICQSTREACAAELEEFMRRHL